MREQPYRVIQWATGKVGTAALRHFHENPAFALAGVHVTSADKAGKDAGELIGVPPIGVITGDDPEAVLRSGADCVHFAPARQDIAMVCRMLRAGLNVVSPIGPFYLTDRSAPEFAEIEAACRAGGTTFHGSGIHPGFSGDLLPLTLTRIMDRVDHIHIHEVVDHLANPSNYIEMMGFGREPDDLLANPGRAPEAPLFFAESMALVAKSLGTRIERLTTKFAVAAATRDIVHARGTVRAGTVAGQHYEWTGWADGRPLITYHFFWRLGTRDMTPEWDCGEPGYRIVIEGNPPMDVFMRQPVAEHGTRYISSWTAMAGVNAIPAVCDAPPGVVTHRELGLLQTRGQFR